MSNIDFDIDKVAALAKIDLTDEQRAKFAKQLPDILAYVSRLNEVDTSDISADAYLTDQHNQFRPDEVQDCEPAIKQAVIDGFPKQKGGALQVPGIFS